MSKFTVTLKYESIVNVLVEAEDTEEASFKAPGLVDAAEIIDNHKSPTVIAIQSHE